MQYSLGRGLDCGTSFVISCREIKSGNKLQYTEMRDAFFRLRPSSPIARSMMEKGLKGQHYLVDNDGSFLVIGQDAIDRAVERHESANRPMARGVISPKEKNARNILRYIFKEVLGEPLEPGEKVVYSIPAQPVDQPPEDFDVGWHQDAIGNDLKSFGFTPKALHEAEAICYSELEEDAYTGISASFGAGMSNWCLMSSGEALLHWSVGSSGDYIDKMASNATGEPETVVQVEKEHGQFVIGKEVPNNPILSAVSLYYVRLIDYTVKHLVQQLSRADKLPKFMNPLPVVIAGGTSRAVGFIEEFNRNLNQYLQEDSSIKLPFGIKEVRPAKDPLRAVARGCLLASQIL